MEFLLCSGMVASKTNKNWNRSYSRAHAVPSPTSATAAAYLMDNVHAERNSVDKWSFCLGRQISDRAYFPLFFKPNLGTNAGGSSSNFFFWVTKICRSRCFPGGSCARLKCCELGLWPVWGHPLWMKLGRTPRKACRVKKTCSHSADWLAGLVIYRSSWRSIIWTGNVGNVGAPIRNLWCCVFGWTPTTTLKVIRWVMWTFWVARFLIVTIFRLVLMSRLLLFINLSFRE